MAGSETKNRAGNVWTTSRLCRLNSWQNGPTGKNARKNVQACLPNAVTFHASGIWKSLPTMSEIYIYIQICFLFCVCTIILIYTHTHLKECPRVLDPGCVPCCSRSKLGQQSFCKCGGPKNHRTKSAGWPNYLGTGCLVPTHDWGGCVNMYASAYQRRITPRWIEASSFFSSVASFLIAQSCVEVLKLPLLDRRVRRERPGARMLFLAQWGLRGRKISRSWQAEKKNEAHKRSQK